MSSRPEPAREFSARGRPRWVVAELDAHGTIDRHAAMCLRHTIEGALTGDPRAILVDLRDLTAIDDAAVALFVHAHADCHVHGVELELLISARANHHAIADALDSAGLLDQLTFTAEPCVSLPTRPRLVLAPAPAPAPAPAGRWHRLRRRQRAARHRPD